MQLLAAQLFLLTLCHGQNYLRPVFYQPRQQPNQWSVREQQPRIVYPQQNPFPSHVLPQTNAQPTLKEGKPRVIIIKGNQNPADVINGLLNSTPAPRIFIPTIAPTAPTQQKYIFVKPTTVARPFIGPQVTVAPWQPRTIRPRPTQAPTIRPWTQPRTIRPQPTAPQTFRPAPTAPRTFRPAPTPAPRTFRPPPTAAPTIRPWTQPRTIRPRPTAAPKPFTFRPAPTFQPKTAKPAQLTNANAIQNQLSQLLGGGVASQPQPRPTDTQSAIMRNVRRPISENYCDTSVYDTQKLASLGMTKVEYFVTSGPCSSEFYECAIGSTFKTNCSHSTLAFDVKMGNCNFKYNIKQCPEYDHIMHCTIKEQCTPSEFACCSHPQSCIPISKRCDGKTDCGNGDDENNCPVCMADEFPCVKSGRCIPYTQRCNGIADECGDGSNSDEVGCGGCEPNKFQCVHSGTSSLGRAMCIDWSLRCNGVRDCTQGEDELNCKTQGPKYLLCENQQNSVSKKVWCDGKDDCSDGSDEKYCFW